MIRRRMMYAEGLKTARGLHGLFPRNTTGLIAIYGYHTVIDQDGVVRIQLAVSWLLTFLGF
jgi:hypothetical protein